MCVRRDASLSGVTTGPGVFAGAATDVALPVRRCLASWCWCGDVQDLLPSGGRERRGAGDVDTGAVRSGRIGGREVRLVATIMGTDWRVADA